MLTVCVIYTVDDFLYLSWPCIQGCVTTLQRLIYPLIHGNVLKSGKKILIYFVYVHDSKLNFPRQQCEQICSFGVQSRQ